MRSSLPVTMSATSKKAKRQAVFVPPQVVVTPVMVEPVYGGQPQQGPVMHMQNMNGQYCAYGQVPVQMVPVMYQYPPIQYVPVCPQQFWTPNYQPAMNGVPYHPHQGHAQPVLTGAASAQP